MMIAVPTPTFPSDNNFVPIVAEKTIQPPTDRSIPPVRITNVMPIAAIPQVTDCANTLLRFETERNLSVNIDAIIHITSNIINTDPCDFMKFFTMVVPLDSFFIL